MVPTVTARSQTPVAAVTVLTERGAPATTARRLDLAGRRGLRRVGGTGWGRGGPRRRDGLTSATQTGVGPEVSGRAAPGTRGVRVPGGRTAIATGPNRTVVASATAIRSRAVEVAAVTRTTAGAPGGGTIVRIAAGASRVGAVTGSGAGTLRPVGMQVVVRTAVRIEGGGAIDVRTVTIDPRGGMAVVRSAARAGTPNPGGRQVGVANVALTGIDVVIGGGTETIGPGGPTVVLTTAGRAGAGGVISAATGTPVPGGGTAGARTGTGLGAGTLLPNPVPRRTTSLAA